MKIPLETLRQIKLDYQRQYNETALRLQELKSVLDQLAEVSLVAEIPEMDTTIKPMPIASAEPVQPAQAKPKNKPKKSKAKRGRKSVWSKFVLSRLRSVNRALTLDDLTNHAIVTMGLDPKSFGETRVSLRSAAYTLQKKYGKLVALPIKGSREKLLALSHWVDEKGKLKEGYTE